MSSVENCESKSFHFVDVVNYHFNRFNAVSKWLSNWFYELWGASTVSIHQMCFIALSVLTSRTIILFVFACWRNDICETWNFTILHATNLTHLWIDSKHTCEWDCVMWNFTQIICYTLQESRLQHAEIILTTDLNLDLKLCRVCERALEINFLLCVHD
jgi:hypothetical protein